MADLEAAVAGLPFTLIGLNPSIPGARLSDGWDDLKQQFRRHRAYVHTTRMPYEDGYNLAMLEAMATGMPVATLAHTSSPIVDGVNGLVGRSGQELALSLLELLEDAEKARVLGAAARDTVAERFPMEAFMSRWTSVLESSQRAR
jgi:glycosyltransferase involved in cell wall biosynthesis